MYSKEDIYLELALVINTDMYNSKAISYQIYKMTEDNLLKSIKR